MIFIIHQPIWNCNFLVKQCIATFFISGIKAMAFWTLTQLDMNGTEIHTNPYLISEV